MIDDIELRRRRAGYRAAHRGTKEMDIMIGRYAAATLPEMNDPALAQFEEFIALPDPELQTWLLTPDAVAPSGFTALVADVRKFHGL
jgi:antitoxin CptB